MTTATREPPVENRHVFEWPCDPLCYVRVSTPINVGKKRAKQIREVLGRIADILDIYAEEEIDITTLDCEGVFHLTGDEA